MQLSMLPQGDTLRRNRQLGVISRTMVMVWLVTLMLMTAWTGLGVLPSFLKSQSESRGFDSLQAEAVAAQSRIKSINDKVGELDTELNNLNIVSTQRGKTMIMDTLPDLVPEGVELSSYTPVSYTHLTLPTKA